MIASWTWRPPFTTWIRTVSPGTRSTAGGEKLSSRATMFSSRGRTGVTGRPSADGPEPPEPFTPPDEPARTAQTRAATSMKPRIRRTPYLLRAPTRVRPVPATWTPALPPTARSTTSIAPTAYFPVIPCDALRRARQPAPPARMLGIGLTAAADRPAGHYDTTASTACDRTDNGRDTAREPKESGAARGPAPDSGSRAAHQRRGPRDAGA